MERLKTFSAAKGIIEESGANLIQGTSYNLMLGSPACISGFCRISIHPIDEVSQPGHCLVPKVYTSGQITLVVQSQRAHPSSAEDRDQLNLVCYCRVSRPRQSRTKGRGLGMVRVLLSDG